MIKFNTKTTGAAKSHPALPDLQKKVKELFSPSEDVTISVTVTHTLITRNGVTMHLPFGISDLSNGTQRPQEALQTLLAMFPNAAQPTAFGATPAPAPAPTTAIPLPPEDFDDMTDQQWAEHVAAALFPGTLPLHKAAELYQPVVGTSTGSIYRVCFIGPELRVAARIQGSKLSFRATTDKGACPTGVVRDVLKRLGMESEYEDRMTAHVQMEGPYDTPNSHAYPAGFGAYYAALKPWITSNYPAIGKLTKGVA